MIDAFTDSVVSPPRVRLTRADCAVLELAGRFDHQKIELIDGDLIDKMRKNWPHVTYLILLQNWLVQTFGFLYVAPEAPINVSPEDNPTNEPMPDLMVLNRPCTEFEGKNKPSPSDVRLLAEISDTTLRFDMTAKAGLYARAGIAEYWVLDIGGRRLAVHRDVKHGEYQSITWHAEDEVVTPLSASEAQLVVSSLFVG